MTQLRREMRDRRDVTRKAIVRGSGHIAEGASISRLRFFPRPLLAASLSNLSLSLCLSPSLLCALSSLKTITPKSSTSQGLSACKHLKPRSLSSLFASRFDAKNMMCAADPRHGRYLTAAALFRGRTWAKVRHPPLFQRLPRTGF